MRKLGLVLVLLLAAAFLVAAPIESPAVEKPVEKPAMTEGQAPNSARISYHVEKNPNVIKASWNYKIFVNGELVEDPFLTGSYWRLSSFTIYDFKNYHHQLFLGTVDGTTATGGKSIGTSTGTKTTKYSIPDNITTTWTFIAGWAGNAIIPCDHEYSGATSDKPTLDGDAYASLYIPVEGGINTGDVIHLQMVDYGVRFDDPNIDNSSYLFLLRPFGNAQDPSWTWYTTDLVTSTTSFGVQYFQQRIDTYTAKMKIVFTYTGSSSFVLKRIVLKFANMDYGHIDFVNPITVNNGDAVVLDITINVQ
ncbi:hypothetical protein [Thermococcus sp. 21S7]|uniref:hypothetical protein n=1 Tax=Thermococcus sp. 21S7 TaxID=1638221 RepID=UPI00143A43FA|nr:hypothetical protein [Thermococcus sp. 21S7]NJE60463.1 hypothetical protein [Thermococcus sp. 21S7]